MMQFTVYFKRTEMPTKITITGEEYSWSLDESSAMLTIESDSDTESDYVFNWNEVLYFEQRPA